MQQESMLIKFQHLKKITFLLTVKEAKKEIKMGKVWGIFQWKYVKKFSVKEQLHTTKLLMSWYQNSQILTAT